MAPGASKIVEYHTQASRNIPEFQHVLKSQNIPCLKEKAFLKIAFAYFYISICINVNSAKYWNKTFGLLNQLLFLIKNGSIFTKKKI